MTDFNEDKSKSTGDSFKDRILNELEEANRLKGIEDDGTLKSIVDSVTVDSDEIDPNFNWQEEAAKLKEQEEAAAKSAAQEQERALEEAKTLRKIQAEEHLKDLDSLKQDEPEPVEQAQEPSSELKVSPLTKISSEAAAPEIADVDLAGFTIPIPIKDINSVSLEAESSPQVSSEEEVSTSLDSTSSDQPAEALSDQQEAVTASEPEPALDLPEEVKEAEADSEPDQEEPKATSSSASRENKRTKKKKRLARRISSWIISLILLLLLAGGGFGYYYVHTSLAPLDSKASKYVAVKIPKGAGNKEIGQILQKEGLIKDANVFNYYTKFKNYSDFKSGYYNLRASMSLEEIIKQLQAGGTDTPTDPSAGKIVIPEGYTIDQIAKAIESNANTKVKDDKTPYKSKDFLKLMKDESFINKMKEKYPRLLADLPAADKVRYQLEGYLFPATYDYNKDLNLEDLVDQMLATMDSYLAQYYDTISQSKYNVNETLALASLIEKEGQTDEDRRNIASVFYNRLEADMPLQSNIAILYATGQLGKKTSLKEDANVDTNIDSPFNDYKNKGIIPGPVDSPSLSAIEAAINPSDTKYLYFVADVETGNVYYSETYEEHEKNVETYVNQKVADSSSNK